MAQYFTDFTDYPAGPITNEDWTADSGGDQIEWNVVHNGSSSELVYETTGGNDMITWDGFDGSNADVEIYTKFLDFNNDTSSTASFVRQTVRARSIQTTYLNRNLGTGDLTLDKLYSGSFSNLGIFSDGVDDSVAFSRKLGISGSVLKGKSWNPTGNYSEPADYGEVVDSQITDGNVGIMLMNMDKCVIGEVGIGTYGDIAPASLADIPDSPSTPTNLTADLI